MLMSGIERTGSDQREIQSPLSSPQYRPSVDRPPPNTAVFPASPESGGIGGSTLLDTVHVQDISLTEFLF